MTHAQTMLDTHPRPLSDRSLLSEILHELEECTPTCRLCADAYLRAKQVVR